MMHSPAGVSQSGFMRGMSAPSLRMCSLVVRGAGMLTKSGRHRKVAMPNCNNGASAARLCSNRGISILFRPFPCQRTNAPTLGELAEQIRRTGARATPARLRVLQLLRDTPAALTHNEIELALGPFALDRVTLYRVLDWLVECGLAHKNSDAQRVFRFFGRAIAGEHATHTHFRCEHCGGVFCLDAAPPAAPRLPAGFSLSRMDFDLRGRCANCTRTKS